MASKSNQVKMYEYPLNRPELYVGSIWITKTRRHKMQQRVVVGINKNRTSVVVRAATSGPAQHKGQLYTVNAEIFIREHEKVS